MAEMGTLFRLGHSLAEPKARVLSEDPRRPYRTVFQPA